MSGYIMDLRQIVGHRTLIQCAASIICVDRQGRILLGKRTDNHKWGYSGGAIEIDETVEDCARRELLEEMGITAGELELFYINSGPEAHYTYPNGDEVSNVEIIYICRDYSGEIRPQEEEIEEIRYFSIDELDLDQISPPIRPVMKRFFRRSWPTRGGNFVMKMALAWRFRPAVRRRRKLRSPGDLSARNRRKRSL